MWEAICGSCGTKQEDLLDQRAVVARAAQYNRVDFAPSFRRDLQPQPFKLTTHCYLDQALVLADRRLDRSKQGLDVHIMSG